MTLHWFLLTLMIIRMSLDAGLVRLSHVTSLFDIIYYNFKQEFRPFSDFEFVSIFVLDGVVSKRSGKFFQKFPKFLYPG